MQTQKLLRYWTNLSLYFLLHSVSIGQQRNFNARTNDVHYLLVHKYLQPFAGRGSYAMTLAGEFLKQFSLPTENYSPQRI
jgi:hypothetical protein